LGLFQRAAEEDKTILVDGTMNANPATKPRMMSIKDLAKNGPAGVLEPRCTTTSGPIDHWTRMRRFLARFSASHRSRSWADSITTTSGFEFSVQTTVSIDTIVEIRWSFVPFGEIL
jgi:hypothetical protein